MNSRISTASTPDLKKWIQVRERAIAKEKVVNRWRIMAIVIMGLIISIGLAVLSDAALSHSIFLGGVGLTIMITAVQYYKHQSERKITQLKQEQALLVKQIKKRAAMAADRKMWDHMLSFKKENPLPKTTEGKPSSEKGSFPAKSGELPELRYVDAINIPLQGG
ncbi:MAG: hypothetical protein K2Q33_02325 [Gammaproteobacteria bacterium]|nr:hypothetical protein [Gammaproteobacteria bacterium]